MKVKCRYHQDRDATHRSIQNCGPFCDDCWDAFLIALQAFEITRAFAIARERSK